jgi:hypothetical protein
MVIDKLSDPAADALMEAISKGHQTNPDRVCSHFLTPHWPPGRNIPIDTWHMTQQVWLWIISAIGGPNSAMSTMFPSDSTSYSHRSSLFLWELGDSVNDTSTYPANAGIQWVNQFVDIVERKEGKKLGMYYNYADPTIGEHEVAGRRYWPGNYERLAELKRIWDGGSVFENPQSIGV